MGQTQDAAIGLRCTARVVDRGVELGKRPPCTLEEDDAGRCQLDAPRGPYAEYDPEFALQLSDCT